MKTKLKLFSALLISTAFAKPAIAGNEFVNFKAENPALFEKMMATPECENFRDYTHGTKYPNWGHGTNQVAVVQNGKLMYEWADGNYSLESSHTMWSVSKTISATLVGAAIQQGRLSLQDKVAKFFPERKVEGPFEANWNKITIEHLLEMTSGLDWHEKYEDGARTSSVIQVMYSDGRHDVLDFILKTPMSAHVPGKHWAYSGGDNMLALGVLKKIYGKDYKRMPWKLLFDKLGMKSARVEMDNSGNFVGAMYYYLNARDMAKLGQLFLNEGMWNGERILPEGWSKRAQTMTPAIANQAFTRDFVMNKGIYSQAGFWLNASPNGLEPTFDLPLDTYVAAGHYGQTIVIIPSLNFVMTRTSYYKDYWVQIRKITWNAVKCLRHAEVKQ